MSDNITQFLARLRRFTYKPGWTFDAYFNTLTPYITLTIFAMVIDTYNPTEMVTVRCVKQIDYFYLDENDEQFARRLQIYIFEMELHESREWLRLDGEIFDNPHGIS